MKQGYVYSRILSNGRTWVAAIPDNLHKTGYERISGFRTKSDAYEYLNRRKYQTADIQTKGTGEGNILYKDFFKEWLEYIEKSFSYQTYKTYAGVLKDFNIFMGQKHPHIQWLYELNPRIFDSYKLWLRDTGYKDKNVRQSHKSTTINNHLKTFKAMFNRAIYWEYLEKNPIKRVDLVSVEDEKPIVTLNTPDKFNLFFSRCKEIKPEYYPHYYCTAKLGLRFGEMATLKWSSVNFEDNTVRIVRDEAFNPKGRNKKDKKPRERTIPMSPDVAEIINALPRINKYVFLKKRKPIDRKDKTFRNWIIVIVRETELEGMTRFHELRHTAGDILGQTYGIYDIKEFLGHSDIRTTERYVRVADKRKREMADTLGKFGQVMKIAEK